MCRWPGGQAGRGRDARCVVVAEGDERVGYPPFAVILKVVDVCVQATVGVDITKRKVGFTPLVCGEQTPFFGVHAERCCNRLPWSDGKFNKSCSVPFHGFADGGKFRIIFVSTNAAGRTFPRRSERTRYAHMHNFLHVALRHTGPLGFEYYTVPVIGRPQQEGSAEEVLGVRLGVVGLWGLHASRVVLSWP